MINSTELSVYPITSTPTHRLAPAMLVALLAVSALILCACGGSGSHKTISAEDQFARAKKLYERRKYFESAEEFQKVVYNYPGSSLIDTAQFYLANSYLEDEQYELAAVEFERLIKNYPRSGFAPDSRFFSGYARYLAAPTHYGLDQTDLREAIRIIDDFVIDYPESELIPEAKKALAEAHSRLAKKYFKSAMVYVHSRAFTSALIYFEKVIDEYPKTDYAALALLEKGKAQLKLNQLEKSAATFNTFLAQYPNHRFAKNASDELENIEKKLSEITPETTAQDSEEPSDSVLQSATTSVDSAVDSEMR